MPSAGTATNVAVQRPSRTMPGQAAAGRDHARGQDERERQARLARHDRQRDLRLPSASGSTANAVTAAGAGPSDGPVARKTNGKPYRPHGTLAGADRCRRSGIQPPGASGCEVESRFDGCDLPGRLGALGFLQGPDVAPERLLVGVGGRQVGGADRGRQRRSESATVTIHGRRSGRAGGHEREQRRHDHQRPPR